MLHAFHLHATIVTLCFALYISMRPMQRGTYARFRRQETQRREQNAVRNRKKKAVMNIGRGHLNAHEQDDKDNNDGEESNGKGEDEKGQVTHK
jgi:hypothetical protein